MTICGGFIRGLAQLPPDVRADVRADALEGQLATTTEAVNLVEELRARLRAAVVDRNDKLAGLCLGVTGGMGSFSNHTRQESDYLRVGLRMEKVRQPVGRPAAPTELRGTPGLHEGSVQLRCRRPVRRCIIFVQMATDADGPAEWRAFPGRGSTTLVITGLRSGERYWFRVAALNQYGESPWTPPIPDRAA